MVRLVSDAEGIWQLLMKWLDGRATLERGSLVPAMRLNTVPGFETTVAAFATDMPELTRWGKGYLYGPGSIHVAHTAHERITRAELLAAVDGYVRLAEAALADVRKTTTAKK